MEEIWNWGAQLIVTIQAVHNPALDHFFNIITLLGGEEFFLLLLPVLYWSINKPLAQRLAYLLLFSTHTSEILKGFLGFPRPFEYDLRVLRLDRVSSSDLGYGFPSGHSQSVLSVWGYLAARVSRRWIWLLAGSLIILVAFSRMYLGVHFPIDVLGGFLVGGIWLGLFLWLEPRLTPRLSLLALGAQLALAIGVPAILLLVYSSRDAIAAMGTSIGLGVGVVLDSRFMRFSTNGPVWQKLARLVLGAAVVVVLREGLSPIPFK